VTGGCTSFGTADRATPRCLARQGEAPRSGHKGAALSSNAHQGAKASSGVKESTVADRTRARALAMARDSLTVESTSIVSKSAVLRGAAFYGDLRPLSAASRASTLGAARIGDTGAREEQRGGRSVCPNAFARASRPALARPMRLTVPMLFLLSRRLPLGLRVRMSTRTRVRTNRFGYASARRFGCRSRPASSRFREARVKPSSKGVATGEWPGI
jgi:hypothetical protein